MVVSVFRGFLAAVGPHERFPSVRVVKSGSEPLSPADRVAITRHFSPECRVLVGYGTTETGNITHSLVDCTAPAANDVVFVGVASEGMEILVLDEREKPLPAGEPGLLAVRGRYLADGYWKRPEQTARVFRADPDGSDRRIYLTGDRGRIRADGTLVKGTDDFA